MAWWTDLLRVFSAKTLNIEEELEGFNIEFSYSQLNDLPYSQTVFVYDNFVLLAKYRGSSLPNPVVPRWSKGSVPHGTELPDAYPMVAEGNHKGIYSDRGHNGKPGISLYDNGPCPIQQEINPQTKLTYATNIDIHSGYNETWKGSAGCLTIHPQDYSFFISHFREGDEVVVSVPPPLEILRINVG